MRKNLGMEWRSSMEAVCDHDYDIFCHVQWNVHGAHTSSMRTWNHMVLAVKSRRARDVDHDRNNAQDVSVLTSRPRPR